MDEAKVNCAIEAAPARIAETKLITEKRAGATWVKGVAIEGEDVIHLVR